MMIEPNYQESENNNSENLSELEKKALKTPDNYSKIIENQFYMKKYKLLKHLFLFNNIIDINISESIVSPFIS